MMHYICFLFPSLLCFVANISALPLFEYRNELAEKIPYISFAQLPTPVQQATNLEEALQHKLLFIKRDDLTGTGDLYGGNKVRKLEFLLADALHNGANHIITFGAAGTNHGLATACYAHLLGLDCTLMLRPQRNSPVVRQNLLLDLYYGATILLFASTAERNAAAEQLLQEQSDTYFIPVGGSVPCGCLGYVNAAFELKKQIEEGLLPKPDYIYLPLGSCGTTAGLLLGLTLAQLDSKLVAIAIEGEATENYFLEKIKKLFTETNELLHALAADIPLCNFPIEQCIIDKRFCATGYGIWTPETDAATALLHQTDGIALEGTYSAKACAAMIADIYEQVRKPDDVILFWLTYCGADFSQITNIIDYRNLPEALHILFEKVLEKSCAI